MPEIRKGGVRVNIEIGGLVSSFAMIDIRSVCRVFGYTHRKALHVAKDATSLCFPSNLRQFQQVLRLLGRNVKNFGVLDMC